MRCDKCNRFGREIAMSRPSMTAHSLIGILAFFPLLMLSSCGKPTAENILLRIDGDRSLDRGLGAQMQQFADVTGDGVPEILAASPFEGLGEIGLYSGSSGELVYRISSDIKKYSVKFFSVIADLNGDKLPEIAAPSSGSESSLWIFSGKDGLALFKLDEKLFFDYYELPRILSVPDKNSDGVFDLALEQPKRSLIVFSGKDGQKIMELDPPKTLDEHVRYDKTPDIDGDGNDDIMGLTTVRRPIRENVFELVTRVQFISSKDFSPIGTPFIVPLQERERPYRCSDMNGDNVMDIVACAPFGGQPKESSVLLAVSGRDGSEIWRVNGGNVEGGSTMTSIDAKTREKVATYTDIRFGDALALLPDANGDGIAEVATGHPELYNKERKIGGCIYIFSGKDGTILRTIFSPDKNSRIGGSIAPFADLNFDGTTDILAGVPGAMVDKQKEVGSILVLPT